MPRPIPFIDINAKDVDESPDDFLDIDLENPVSDDQLNQGLVSWWLALPQQSGGPRFQDLRRKNIGSLLGGATWSKGSRSRNWLSLSTDGVDDSVSCGALAPTFTNVTSFSGTAWVKTTGTAGTIVGNYRIGTSPGWTFHIGSGVDAGKFGFGLFSTNGSAGRIRLNTTTINDGTWKFVAFTYNGSNASTGITLYLNGVSVAIGTDTNSNPSTAVNDTLIIGARVGSSTDNFTGNIDDVRLFGRVLLPEEIRQLYFDSLHNYRRTLNRIAPYYTPINKTVRSINPGWIDGEAINDFQDVDLENPVSDEVINTGSLLWLSNLPQVSGGSRWLDLSRKLNGSISSGATWVKNSRDGLSSLLFDGTDDFVTCGGSPVLNPPEMTISVIVNFASFANPYNCVFCRIQDTTHFYQLLVKSTGKLAPYLYASVAVNYDGTGAFTLQANVWYHLTFVYSGGAGLRCYVNGQLDGSAAASGAMSTAAADLVFGKDTFTAGRLFNGSMREARMWNMAMSPEQVLSLYNDYLSGNYKTLSRIPNPSFPVLNTVYFDATENAGYQSTASTYTFSRTFGGGDNGYMLISVETLTVAGTTVTSIVDDFGIGNIQATFIGAKSTVDGASRVEIWEVREPTPGTRTVQVNLSASCNSTANATCYTNVNISNPYSGFNSAQATNVGAADATVAITSPVDGCVVYAVAATDDTTITAGQNSRNNVTGASGSGANEDFGQRLSGVKSMNYTDVGAGNVWAIAGLSVLPNGAIIVATSTRTTKNTRAYQLGVLIGTNFRMPT